MVNAAADPAEIARRMARHAGTSETDYREVFRECEAALDRSRLSRHAFEELVRRMSAVESEVLHGR